MIRRRCLDFCLLPGTFLPGSQIKQIDRLVSVASRLSLRKQTRRSMEALQRYWRFWLVMLSTALLPVSLSAQLQPMGQAGKTRAVVIGISDYQNPRIPKLLYAHADAQAFADYLRSPAGGALPADQVKLLVNEQATQGQMAIALTWLLDESQEGDQAIIYFSGHGDVETKTKENHGYLLAYDAPASTYMIGGAFPVYFLQSIIETLSVERNVQVLLIADACHAGQLAGSAIGGAQATASALAKQFTNEVRLLSCQADEFSIEGPQWGGGHGVFTYYLLDGLMGLADMNADAKISFRELDLFLGENVPAAAAPHEQLPNVLGDKRQIAAIVDPPTLAALQAARADELSGEWAGAVAVRAVPKAVDSDSMTMVLYRRFLAALEQKHLLYPAEDAAYTLYLDLRDRPALREQSQEMRRNLAAALQDEAQQAINDYVGASPEELRRRWSYDERYERFPSYLEKAAEVLGSDHFMYHDLKTKELYFSGLNLRLKGERERDAALYEQALSLQEQTLQLDSAAAYAYNELGLLARRKGDYAASIEHFQKALALSPTWVLAEANLCGSYVDLEQPEEALQSCQRALQRDSTFALAHHNLGAAYNAQERYPEAIAALGQALRYDAEYFMSHHLLGNAYYFSQRPEQALAAWQEAVRLNPAHALSRYNFAFVLAEQGHAEEALEQFYALADLQPGQTDAWLEIAELQMAAGRFAEAQAALDTCAQLNPSLPDTDYLRARWHALQDQPASALDALQAALEKGLRVQQLYLTDPHFDGLRSHERFIGLMQQYFGE
jgi:protein O-mannosyl-transferase